MYDPNEQTSRFRVLARYVADHPAAAALILMIDDCFLDTRVDKRVLRPENIPVNVPPFGTEEDTLALLRALRRMSFIEATSGGFKITSTASHVVSALRIFLQRDSAPESGDVYTSKVVRLLKQSGALQHDASIASRVNYNNVLCAISALEPLLVAEDVARWLSHPRDEFAGEAPLALLARGEVDRVTACIATAGFALYF